MNVQFTNDEVIKNMTFKEWMKKAGGEQQC